MSAIFTEKELSRYSVTKALHQVVQSQANQPPGYPGELSGIEREVDEALRTHFSSVGAPAGRMGFLLPLSCLKGLSVTTATQGGFLVDSSFAASIVPALR